ncbi:NlpC/P60 family protein [Govanella unica]|uniref:C40 family peptidase n=1 Tax=Govanella unica TaxID=2975056 RepID=A0A9X3Z878_9PROT|nr:NlpC/P60 family protein [Govania unica]MDA5194957.1 C40 family peptidase [Govania unica]
MDCPSNSAADLRAAIVDKGRSYLGTPFRHQGRAPGRGLDCIGVVACIGRELGLFDYDATGYARQPTSWTSLRRHVDAAGFVRVETAKPGDVYLMAIIDRPQHVALVTDRGMLHAWMHTRSVVEHGLDALWASRVVSIYRFPGVCD